MASPIGIEGLRQLVLEKLGTLSEFMVAAGYYSRNHVCNILKRSKTLTSKFVSYTHRE